MAKSNSWALSGIALVCGGVGGYIGAHYVNQKMASNASTLEEHVQVLELIQDGLSKQASDLEVRVYELQAVTEELRLKHNVDFTVTDIQEFGDGFALSRAAQQEHLTGIRFTGRIINKSSVNYLNTTFEIRVGGESKEFMINRISAGNSTGFNVYVPGLPATQAATGQLRFVRGTVSYAAT